MNESLKIKLCGLTRPEDVGLAVESGADFLGFIGYAKSPRAISIERAGEVADAVDPHQRVYVDIAPSLDTLARAKAAGFGNFQIHFEPDTDPEALEAWSREVGPAALWLAPRLANTSDFKDKWLSLAHTFLLDTYAKDRVGGTGQTGDWAGFRDLRETHPGRNWVLAGGLDPDNLADAVAATGTAMVDVNSGVESSPGIKDHGKVKRLFGELERLTAS